MHDSYFIESKLNPPVLKKSLLERNGLRKICTESERRGLTVITAPGGYGKTVLASQIIEASDLPFIWYRLDEEDNDPNVFFYYLFKGFSQRIKGFDKKVSIIVSGIGNGKDNAYSAASFFVEELEALENDIYLVFDDFHNIDDKYILDFLNVFLKYLPAKLHVIITSRKGPELDIVKLKSTGQAFEITKGQLQFSYDEFLRLNESRGGQGCESDALENIYAKSEGWPLALDIFLNELVNGRNIGESLLPVLSVETLAEYFSYQVFNALPNEVQQFLLDICVLDIITPDACNYLSGNEDAEELLQYLVSHNVFIGRLAGGKAYVCHRIFREFLEGRLGTKASKQYAKAGEFWFGIKKYDESIEYFIKCRNAEKAIKAFRFAGIEAVRRGRFKTAERWIDFFENVGLSENVWILLAKSLLCAYKGMFDISEDNLKRVGQYFENEFNNGDVYGYSIVMLIRSKILYYRYSLELSVKETEKVIALGGMLDDFTLYDAFAQKATGEFLLGDFDEAVVTLETGIDLLEKRSRHELAIFLKRFLIAPYFLKFEYQKALFYYKQVIILTDEEINLNERLSVDLYAARIYRDLGRLDDSKALIEDIIRKKLATGCTEELFHVYYHFATLYRDIGDYELAMKYAKLSEKLFSASGSKMEFTHLVRELEALILSDMGSTLEGFALAEEELNGLLSGKSKWMVEVAYHSAGIAAMRAGKTEKAAEYLESGLVLSRQRSLKSMVPVCSGILSGIYYKTDIQKSLSLVRECLTNAALQSYLQVFLTDPDLDWCLAAGFINNIEIEFVLEVLNRLGKIRINNILKLILLNGNYDTVLKFIEEVNIDISSNTAFAQIAATFISDDNDTDLKNVVAMLKPSDRMPHIELPSLVVICFNTFSAYSPLIDGIRIKWRTSKAKELLAYFIHNAGKEIITEKLLADIWPELDGEKARNLLHTNLSHVRKVLELCGLRENIEKIQSGYLFKKDGIYCDEWFINDSVSNGGASNGETSKGVTSTGEAAVVQSRAQLLSRPYLDDIYSDWVIEAREEYENILSNS
jgi:LuxR family transcriptional regulator, maltose regulon positive regulatory protein